MKKLFSRVYPNHITEQFNAIELAYGVREATEEEILEEWETIHIGQELHDVDGIFREEHKFVYYITRIPMGRWNYSGIVESIIRDKYTADQIEAINNNMSSINAVFMQTLVTGGIVEAIKFLRESADTADAETFREMQEWRVMAKMEAKSVLNIQ